MLRTLCLAAALCAHARGGTRKKKVDGREHGRSQIPRPALSLPGCPQQNPPFSQNPPGPCSGQGGGHACQDPRYGLPCPGVCSSGPGDHPDGLGRAPARRHLSLRLSTSLVDEALSIYVSVLYAVVVALKLQSLPIPLPHVCRFAVFPCKLTFSLSNIPSTGGASIMSLVSQEEMWNSSRLRMTTQRRAMASRCLH